MTSCAPEALLSATGAKAPTPIEGAGNMLWPDAYTAAFGFNRCCVVCIYALTLHIFCTEQGTVSNSSWNRGVEFKNTTIIGRSRRFIIYDGVGVVKVSVPEDEVKRVLDKQKTSLQLVLGAQIPIVLADKMRSLSVFYNLQMQYSPPPVPLYWWSLYNTSTFAARKQRAVEMLQQKDNSRMLLYKYLETYFDSLANSSQECLLKAICEITRAPLTEEDYDTNHEYTIDDDNGRNIYHRLINAIFTPHLTNVDQLYLVAKEAGLRGANCQELYPKCPIVDELLERFTTN
ncbi:uncharacterized protein LOC106088884 [Stomoxys calcitrans]|uniref:uncharacterized protein LOC106088884 n=1 Tax=Stomoxys calcitrans TaxID=35570 RepID=UPI0027E368C6|nr:uncharacterized protein LOC106088884 [Stomoxys calcitrans]